MYYHWMFFGGLGCMLLTFGVALYNLFNGCKTGLNTTAWDMEQSRKNQLSIFARHFVCMFLFLVFGAIMFSGALLWVLKVFSL